MTDLPFRDRRHAGQVLAQRLAHWRHRPGLLVLALPRGGVPVGDEVARALDAPLDVLVVRKLGAPWHPEFAIGALASGGVRVMQPEADAMSSTPPSIAWCGSEQVELERRERLYRGDRPRAATGRPGGGAGRRRPGHRRRPCWPPRRPCARRSRPPCASRCRSAPSPPAARWRRWPTKSCAPRCRSRSTPSACSYRQFPQTTDEEVREVLAAAARRAAPAAVG